MKDYFKKINIHKIFRVIISITFIVLIIFYVSENWEELKIFTRLDLFDVFLVIIASLINSLANAAKMASIFRALGAPIKLGESFGLSVVGAAAGLFLPQGATLTKTVYLKQRYKIPYTHAPVIFFGALIVFFLMGGIMLLIINLISLLIIGNEVPSVVWWLSVLSISSVLFLGFDLPDQWVSKAGHIGELFKLLSAGWKQLRTNRNKLLEASLYQFIIFLTSGMLTTALYHALDLKVDFLIGVSIAVFVSFSHIITITPGNLGIQESVFGYISHLSGMLFFEGVAVSALQRATGLIVIIVLAPIFWYFLFIKPGIKVRKDTTLSIKEER